jgi:hypothetical protein
MRGVKSIRGPDASYPEAIKQRILGKRPPVRPTDHTGQKGGFFLFFNGPRSSVAQWLLNP